jgi:rhodanese-related sulfurtransferase
MIFRQLFDPQSSTYTYLLADSLTREAVPIDPVFEHARRDVALIGEEKKYNPRLALAIHEADFTGYMTNLGLAHPKLMDVAVPANLRCGRPEKEDMSKAADTDWAPLAVTFAGIWELQPDWVAENPGRAQLLDVREPAEFTGSLGRIAGAKLIPLGFLLGSTEQLSKEKPIVVVCRSGARSAQATVMLKSAGFARVANLAGGMLRWRAQHLPVEGGTD